MLPLLSPATTRSRPNLMGAGHLCRLSGSLLALALLAAPGTAHALDITPTPPEQLSRLDPQMRAVIEQVDRDKQPAFYSVTPSVARALPPIAVPVRQVARKMGKDTAPEAVAEVKDLKFPGPGGTTIPARIYYPAGFDRRGTGTVPALVYFHGGGWVVGSTNAYDASCRALANAGQCAVISVDYRRAPEAKFPAAPEDCYAVTQAVLNSPDPKLRIDRTRVAVGGESAGGNLATVVCLMAKDRKGAMPVHQLLIYPVVDNQPDRPSDLKYATMKPLPLKNLPWFLDHYLPDGGPGQQTRYAFPLRTGVSGLPPATVITADDVLRDEGAAYAKKLQGAGVPVAYRHYPGVTHEFFGMGLVVDKAKQAQAFAGGRLRTSFAGANKPTGPAVASR